MEPVESEDDGPGVAYPGRRVVSLDEDATLHVATCCPSQAASDTSKTIFTLGHLGSNIFASKTGSMSSQPNTPHTGSTIFGSKTGSMSSLPSTPSGDLTTASVISRQAEQTFQRVLARSKSIDEDTLELLSFAGQEHLLRGSGLSTLLSGGARVFKSSAGSASTYVLSKQVDKIDAFISHNWCVSRNRKYIALALHFNFGIAAWTTALGMAALTAAGAAGALPAFALAFGRYPRGVCCRIICVPLFLLSLLLCRDVCHCVGLQGPTLFLDKTCIDQVDSDLQQQGISKLGAFLFSSRQMVVIYSDFYLQRLWTVYEVASFLVLHPVDHMKVLPASLSGTIVTGLLCMWVANISAMLLELWLGFAHTFDIAVFILIYCLIRSIRQYMKERAAIQERLARFTVKDCSCFVEEDRPILYDRIASLMRAAQLAPPDASNDDALSHFDYLVQAALPQAMTDSMGKSTLKFKHALVPSVLGIFPYFLDKQVGWASGMSAQYFVADLLFYLTISFAVGPVALAFAARLAQCCIRLSGWHEQAFSILILLCTVLCGLLLLTAMDLLTAWGYESDAGIAAEATLSLLLFLLLFALYRPRHSAQAGDEGAGEFGRAHCIVDSAGLSRPSSMHADEEEVN